MAQDPAMPPLDGPALTTDVISRGQRLRDVAISPRLATIAARLALAMAILVMLGAAGLVRVPHHL